MHVLSYISFALPFAFAMLYSWDLKWEHCFAMSDSRICLFVVNWICVCGLCMPFMLDSVALSSSPLLRASVYCWTFSLLLLLIL